jgi:uncharacterized protein (TIGR03435 family)
MAFDVASVRPNKSDAQASSRFPLGPGDAYQNGGTLSASNQPLIVYLRFAFKLGQGDLLGLPGWVYRDRFDIDARVQGNPTKDHMRLMMQSVLADRFKLVTHTETQTKAVLNLVLAKAGRTGPQLRAHPENGPCATASKTISPVEAPLVRPAAPSSTSGVQLQEIPCGSAGATRAGASNRAQLGGRSVTIGKIAGLLTNPFTGVDRPVLDRTGLAGTFDFSLEWSPAPDLAQPPSPQLDDTGPTFLEALQEQLGLRLKPATGPVKVLVVDHVEQPSPN